MTGGPGRREGENSCPGQGPASSHWAAILFFQGSWTRWRAPTSHPCRESPETSLLRSLLLGFLPPCSMPQPRLSR